jgi:hypothetical protein
MSSFYHYSFGIQQVYLNFVAMHFWLQFFIQVLYFYFHFEVRHFGWFVELFFIECLYFEEDFGEEVQQLYFLYPYSLVELVELVESNFIILAIMTYFSAKLHDFFEILLFIVAS